MYVILPSNISEENMPEHYELSITPEPLAKPATDFVPSVFEVSLETDVQYSFNLASVNCAGRSSSVHKTVQICKICHSVM